MHSNFTSLRWLIVAFVAGAAFLQTRPELPEMRLFWLLPPLWLALGLLPRGRLRVGLALALVFLTGFFYATWRADMRLAETLPTVLEGRDMTLAGRVRGLPESTPRGKRLVLDVSEAPVGVPRRVQVSIFHFGDGPHLNVRGGDCLRLGARLGRPHGSVNPGGFDYEAWLLERGIRAQGYAVGEVREADCVPDLRAWIDRARETMRERLLTSLSGQPYAGVVVALAVGDQNAIDSTQWILFRTTGVTHLMSISGLHVTLLASLIYAVVNALWRRTPLTARLPARRVAALAGLATASGYVALAGFGLPAQRTLFMVATVAAGLWFNRADSPTRLLAVAALAVTLIDPWAALAPGFWLSFGAVAILMYAAGGRLGQMAWWTGWLRAQWAVTLALAPVLLLLFSEVSLVSPLANALAIPLVSLIGVPLVLAAALLPLDVLAWMAHAVIQLTMWLLAWLATLPQPVLYGVRPGPLALVLTLVGVLMLLAPRGWPGRWLGLPLCLPLLFPRMDLPAQGNYRLHVLDVGQGLATVVRTAGHTLVYDAGPRHASGEDAGARVVAPFLHGVGVHRLDGLVLSHGDSDHSGGTGSLIASHRPVWISGSEPHAGWHRCEAGQRWTWDGVHFEFLHPPARYYDQPGFSDNDRSCVLSVGGEMGSLLLTGDVERLGELSLLELMGERLRADIVVVPHHGSGGSSSPEFVRATRPRLALFSVGARNRFGHPAPEVLDRYRGSGAIVYRTDRQGAIQVDVGAGELSVELARDRARRYWHVVRP